MPGSNEKGGMDVKAIVKKKVPSGAGTPTGTNENGYAIILAKDGIYVNYRWRKFPDELPPESGLYLVVWGRYTRSVCMLEYDAQTRSFNTSLPVPYWLPIPPIPEEVDEP